MSADGTALRSVTANSLTGFTLSNKPKGFQARNVDQSRAIDVCLNPAMPYVGLFGPEGTGKTAIAMACAMKLKDDPNCPIKRVHLFRANVTEDGEKIGFLPGGEHDKIRPYIEPMADALVDLGFQIEVDNPKCDLEEELRRLGVYFKATGFVRGRNLHDSIVVVDEAQNLTATQLRKLLTRPVTAPAGCSRVILCGSLEQIDLPKKSPSGLPFWMATIEEEWPGSIIHLPKTQRGDGVDRLLARAAQRGYADLVKAA